MTLLKERETVFKELESGVFSRLEQSDQSSSDDKYASLKLDNDLNISNNASWNSSPSDIENQLFIPIKKRNRKKMLQRLSIALAQVIACNNSEKLLTEIRQFVYSLYQSIKVNYKSIQ